MTGELDILAIDIDAAIRKLTEKRFKNRDEPALALIRFVASMRPSLIDIHLSKGEVDISADLRDSRYDWIALLSILFDTRRSKDERSQALSRLEHQIGLDVLAAFSGRPKQVLFSYVTAEGAFEVTFRPNRLPTRKSIPRFGRAFRMVIHGGMPRAADAAILSEKCRFAEIPILVNGQTASRGLKIEGSLIRQQLVSASVEGMVGIPKEGDLSHIILLDHGIVSDELYMPNLRGVVFNAVVFGKRCDFSDFYPSLRQSAKRLLPHLAAGYPSLSSGRAKLAETRLFDRYEVTREASLAAGVTAFLTATGNQVDLPTIEKVLKKEIVYAVDEESPLEKYALNNRHVLVLSRKQRRFLDMVLKHPLKTPPKRVVVDIQSKGWLKRVFGVFTGWWEQGAPIEESALKDEERQFLSVLNRVGDDTVRFEMSSGTRLAAFQSRPDGSLCFWVPRQHPAMGRIINRVLSDPDCISPAISLLTDGEL